MFQIPLFARSLPPGFAVFPDAIHPAEVEAVLALLPTLETEPFVLRGQASLRRLASFGVDYRDGVGDAAPPPVAILALRDRAAAVAGLDPAPFVQALVTIYPPGAGIGWHRDYPEYGPVVLGVSLAGPCRFRLRPARASGRTAADVVTVEMAPRTVYALAGASRSAWEHGIPPVAALRVSVTFRSRHPTRSRAP